MTNDLGNTLVLVVSVVLAFLVSRWLASWWKARQKRSDERARRDSESRQVRRARERQGK